MDMLIHIYYGSKIRANTSVVSTQTQIQIKMLTSFLLIAEKMVWLFKDEILFACFFVLFMWEGKGYRKKWQLVFLLLWFCICCLGLALKAHRYWQQMTKLISIDVGALWGLPWMYKTVQNWTPVGHWFIVLKDNRLSMDRRFVPLSSDCPSLPFILHIPSFFPFSQSSSLRTFWHSKKYKIRSWLLWFLFQVELVLM